MLNPIEISGVQVFGIEGSNNREKESFTQQDRIYHRFGFDKISPPSNYTSVYAPDFFSSETRQAYAFTNENMVECVNQEGLALAGKKVACVGGSGDFPIIAVMQGAESVYAVDISPVACFLGELKIEALREFSYEEFLAFFATTGKETFGPQSFSHNQYERLKPNISKAADNFFKQLISADGNSNFLSLDGMIIDNVRDMSLIKGMNPYLKSEDSYETARLALGSKSVTFYPQDIRSFLEEHKAENYNHIYLSSIFAYPPHSDKDDYIDYGEIFLTLERAEESLAPEGEISSYNFLALGEGKTYVDSIQETSGMEGRQITGYNLSSKDRFSFLILKR